MDLHSTLGTLFVIAVVAVLAPVGLALLPGPRIPQVVLPILRENHLLRGLLGSHLLAAGAVGELLPIIAVAVFLGATNRWVALISLAAVTAVAFGLTLLSRSFRVERIRTIIGSSSRSSSCTRG